MSGVNIRATPEQLNELDNLADDLAERAAEIPATAQRIIRKSFPSVLEKNTDRFLPSYVQLGKVNLHWQLFLVNSGGKVTFFFSKRKKQFDNSLVADINMSIRPYQKIDPLDAPAPLGLFWLPPRFIELKPPNDFSKKIKGIKPKKTKSADNVLWLKTGPQGRDRMAVAFDKPLPKSQFIYFKNGQLNCQTEKAKKVPLEWFEILLSAMRPWIAGEAAAPLAIDLRKSDGEIRRILQILSDNFLTISKKMVETQTDPKGQNPLWVNRLCPYYQVSDYSVNVRFRLSKEGTITEEPPSGAIETVSQKKQKDDLFQLLVQLKGLWRQNQPVVHFKILPPDFLIEGPLFEAFLSELLQPANNKKPQQHLKDITQKLDTQPAALSKALSAYQPNAFIFRIKRTSRFDTQMFVLRVIENGKPRTLFFAANFDVDAHNNKVIYIKNSIENLLEKPNGSFELKNKGVRYFMRLLFHINEWKNKVV